jgi:hypothetical protein
MRRGAAAMEAYHPNRLAHQQGQGNGGDDGSDDDEEEETKEEEEEPEDADV